MKRLVISGFACPPDSWQEFLGADTKVISFFDVLNATNSSDVLKWSRYVEAELDRERPDHIICHDYGGVIGLLALWRREKKKALQPKKLTILNTAFRDFDVFKNPHPLGIQFYSWSKLKKGIEAARGHTDDRLEPYFSKIKGTYRRVLFFSVLRKVFRLVKPHQELGIKLTSDILLLASPSDPFIALETMEHIHRDFLTPPMELIDYGHFPYGSKNREAVKARILAFEKS